MTEKEGYYWLNPEEKQRGRFFIHRNETNQYGKYNFSKHRHPESNHRYLGDSDILAKGITAFFISEDDHHIDSLLTRIKYNSHYDLISFFSKYFNMQKDFADKQNRMKSDSEGRISDDAFNEVFIKEHIREEQAYCSYTQQHLIKVPSEGTKGEAKILEYAEEYINWLTQKASKFKTSVKGIKSNLDLVQIKKLHELLITNKIIDGREQDLCSILNPEPIINFNPLKWLVLNKKGAAHQGKLYAFIEILSSAHLNKSFIQYCFRDANNEELNLSNPNRNDHYYMEYKRNFKALIAPIKARNH